jgi:hypothetical protein
MRKIAKQILIWSTILGFLPLIPPAIDEYKLRKEMNKADIRVTTPFVMSWQDIAGFNGPSNRFSRIIVRKTYLPIKVMLPYLSETKTYAPSDSGFSRYSLMLKDPSLFR